MVVNNIGLKRTKFCTQTSNIIGFHYSGKYLIKSTLPKMIIYNHLSCYYQLSTYFSTLHALTNMVQNAIDMIALEYGYKKY